MVAGYQIIHHSEFDKELAELAGNIKIGDDFIKGTIWVISRDPHRGMICEKNVWCFKIAKADILIYYTIKESSKEVCLLSIKKF